jgi:hypothetical protein
MSKGWKADPGSDIAYHLADPACGNLDPDAIDDKSSSKSFSAISGVHSALPLETVGGQWERKERTDETTRDSCHQQRDPLGIWARSSEWLEAGAPLV